MHSIHLYEVRSRKDKRGVDLISNVLPFGRLLYDGLNAISKAIRHAPHYSCSHDAVIRIYDDAGNVIETHEHKGDFKEPYPAKALCSRLWSWARPWCRRPSRSRRRPSGCCGCRRSCTGRCRCCSRSGRWCRGGSRSRRRCRAYARSGCRCRPSVLDVFDRGVIRIRFSYKAFSAYVNVSRAVDGNSLGIVKEIARAVIARHPLLVSV